MRTHRHMHTRHTRALHTQQHAPDMNAPRRGRSVVAVALIVARGRQLLEHAARVIPQEPPRVRVRDPHVVLQRSRTRARMSAPARTTATTPGTPFSHSASRAACVSAGHA